MTTFVCPICGQPGDTATRDYYVIGVQPDYSCRYSHYDCRPQTRRDKGGKLEYAQVTPEAEKRP